MRPQSPGLDALPNLAARSAAWLREVGIASVEDLEAIGAVEAWKRAKAARPDEVTLVLLYALEGALLGMPWTLLPPERKRELRERAGR